ncbi:hypothetical protein PBY51_017014 [Eleginops maclovinus]|nr:hypothetical protein PBY51_017014 [Eleginops maclovinus]
MSASPERTHYLSLPPSVHRMHLLEGLALNKLRRWGSRGFVVLNVVVKSDSNVENRLKRFIFVPRGETLAEMRSDRPGFAQIGDNVCRQPLTL